MRRSYCIMFNKGKTNYSEAQKLEITKETFFEKLTPEIKEEIEIKPYFNRDEDKMEYHTEIVIISSSRWGRIRSLLKSMDSDLANQIIHDIEIKPK